MASDQRPEEGSQEQAETAPAPPETTVVAAPADPVDEPAGPCANQVQVRELGGGVEPASICSCPGGLVHMHDCPIEAGLSCRYFVRLAELQDGEQPDGEPDRILDTREFDELRERLMEDYLGRRYRRRIRELAPEPTAHEVLRLAREEQYAEFTGEQDQGSFDEEAYERDRERLFEQRRRREEQRRKREEENREALAEKRARLGIKTVVERAQEAVAQQGNVASSPLDNVELERKKPARKRRRRRKKRTDGDAGSGAQAAGAPATGGGGKPEGKPSGGSRPEAGEGAGGKRRRRRRRRRPKGKPSDGA